MHGVYTVYHASDIPELTLVNKARSAMRPKMETLTFRVVLESHVESEISLSYIIHDWEHFKCVSRECER